MPVRHLGLSATKNSLANVICNQGFVATTFWSLLANAVVATQIVEDGTMSSIIVRLTAAFVRNLTNGH